MYYRSRLATRTEMSLTGLAHVLHHSAPRRRATADRLASAASRDEDERDMLLRTDWKKWQFSDFWMRYLRRAARLAGTLTVVSNHDRDLAHDLLKTTHPPVVVPNGVDTTVFRPMTLGPVERIDLLRRWLVTEPRGWSEDGLPGSIRYRETDLAGLWTSATFDRSSSGSADFSR
jgi:D-inositol-3-phosphate glycosyltransferase